MRLALEIPLDNAAFGETGMERSEAVAGILHQVAEVIYPSCFTNPDTTPHEAHGTPHSIRDINGNTVGSWAVYAH